MYYQSIFKTNTLVYASVTAKVNNLIEKLHKIKDSLSDPQVAYSKLKFFNKVVSFLHISGQKPILDMIYMDLIRWVNTTMLL